MPLDRLLGEGSSDMEIPYRDDEDFDRRGSYSPEEVGFLIVRTALVPNLQIRFPSASVVVC